AADGRGVDAGLPGDADDIVDRDVLGIVHHELRHLLHASAETRLTLLQHRDQPRIILDRTRVSHWPPPPAPALRPSCRNARDTGPAAPRSPRGPPDRPRTPARRPAARGRASAHRRRPAGRWRWLPSGADR